MSDYRDITVFYIIDNSLISLTLPPRHCHFLPVQSRHLKHTSVVGFSSVQGTDSRIKTSIIKYFYSTLLEIWNRRLLKIFVGYLSKTFKTF